MLTKREQFIKTLFIPIQKKEGVEYMSDVEAEELVKKISAIGNKIGFIGSSINKDAAKNAQRNHKYDVWIAKEIKKDRSLLSRTLDLRLIIDWALTTKADLFAYDFFEANIEQSNWHTKMLEYYKIEDIQIPTLDPNRVVFRFSDKKHFLYLLTPEELKAEGSQMGHCVGSNTNYKTKVKNKISIILSLRDAKNEPHVTIEINVATAQEIQKYGKSNKEPAPKYMKMLKEFVLFASNYKAINDPETLKFLNLQFSTQK